MTCSPHWPTGRLGYGFCDFIRRARAAERYVDDGCTHELIHSLLVHAESRVVAGVGTTPGLIAFTRIFRSFRSTAHARANERTAAFVELFQEQTFQGRSDRRIQH